MSPSKSSKTEVVTVRLPNEQIEVIDRIAGSLDLPLGMSATRSDVIKAALALGLPLLVEQHKPTKQAKKRTGRAR